MTNGPGAMVAEIVENTLPERARPQRPPQATRTTTPLRNHLIDFLVSRSSRSFQRRRAGRLGPAAGRRSYAPASRLAAVAEPEPAAARRSRLNHRRNSHSIEEDDP